MQRRSRISRTFLALLLTPAILGAEADCQLNPPPRLSLLQVEAAGRDRVIAFAPDKMTYQIWIPTSEDTVTILAGPTLGGSTITVSYGNFSISYGTVEANELEITGIELGTSTIFIDVTARENTTTYQVIATRAPEPPICAPASKIVTVGCSDTFNAYPLIPFELHVVPAPIRGSELFTADITGTAFIDEEALDFAQLIIPGGVTQVEVDEVSATVQVRSGASGPDVTLTLDADALVPGPTNVCVDTPDEVCDPANDIDPNDPLAGNSDCHLDSPCGPVINLAYVPTSSDAAACQALGKEGQHLANGFCVTGPLPMPLNTQSTTYAAWPTGGEVLWGWADDGVPGVVLCPDVGEAACASSGGNGWVPDGSYVIETGAFEDPTAPTGYRTMMGVSGPNAVPTWRHCILAENNPVGPYRAIKPAQDANLLACPIH